MSATANVRFKDQYRKYFDVALAISLGMHLLVFAVWGEINITPYRMVTEELEVIELPPEIEIPPPPKEIQRPKIPVEAIDESVDEEETIEDTALDLDDLPPPPPPPPASQEFYVFDKMPKVKKRVIPEYPDLARRAGIEGEVLLKVTIDERGKVMHVTVVRSDAEIFNDAAIRAVKKWRFIPAEQSGNPVKATIVIPLSFTFNK
ncbi:MAG: energy transducer TonB [Gemmatimonadota bacterium]|nr:energy transducer TonB [Gemmatimonadota bacterium]MDP6802303.1 energy transducer TonB [Gemmatimonadota bacterium]MDP7031963.1 energy transducer TonB [Gemmatimonadota bacterium]